MIMDCWGGAKIRCEFSQTQINTDNIVLKTIFHNVPDSTLYVKPETIRKEVEQAFFDAATVLTDFSIKDTVKLNKPYTYLYVNPSGQVVAVTLNDKGKIEEKATEVSANNLKENTLIQGKNGEELVLTKKGQVMGKTEFNATGGNSVLLKEYHRKSDSLAQWQINFISAKEQQVYAFDQIGSGNHGIFSGADYYPQSGSYDFRYKSVECGKSDKVKVEFDTYPQADSVVFKDKYGVTYPISLKDNVLSFTGVSKADTNFIYAYRGDQKIGKLFLNTYQQKTYKVVFVRVNGEAKKLNEKEITKYLNKVYNQCAVKFEISTDTITLNDLTSFSHGGSGVFTVYNDDQKKVLSAYDKDMKDGVYYLFFIDGVTDKKDGNGTPVSGYMPRGYNAGFIYDGGSERTIAHELGHGIAGLEHVFENSNNSGKTKNLMDYSFEKDAEQLWHFQWDQIQDPSRVWMKWNKDESEGEIIEGIPRTEWVLVIYSPYVSDRFHEAYCMRFKDNLYLMRKWTYKALNQSFEGEHLGWYSQQTANYKGIFANEDKKVARLIHFDGAKKDMTVIGSKYDDKKHIVFDQEITYYFPPYEGNFYVKLGLAYANLVDPIAKFIDLQSAQSMLTSLFMGSLKANTFLRWIYYPSPKEQLRKLGLEGLFYPVDIFLYDEKTQKCDGDSYYGPLDFIGVQAAYSAVGGYNNKNSLWDDFLKLLNLNYAESGTLTIGRMRGYGVCAYGATLQNGGGLDVGVALALVGAKYNGSRSDDNYWDIDYSPQKFAGKAVNFSLGYSFISLDYFKAYDDDGYNNFSGGEVEFTLGIPDISGSGSIISEQSTLINLKQYFE